MCGIAGFAASRPSGGLSAGLHRALDRLVHRGPDDGGVLFFPEPPAEPRVGLGNRRLSIIHPGPAGHQPMGTADGRFALTYNGEIYNYRELRRDLAAAGRPCDTPSDTAVLLEAWAAWGTEALGRLEGMFAFALLDRRDGRLILARDPFGIKPLFYHLRPDGVVFASELAALRAFGDVSPEVNPLPLYEYLSSAISGRGAETLFAGVRQVPPAHYVEVNLETGHVGDPVRYATPDGAPPSPLSFSEAAVELRTRILGTVGRHLRSDATLGFSLSGGLDSSTILVAAREVLGPSVPLQAYGFAADDPAISELVHQERAAAAAGATLHQVRVSAADIARDFDTVVDFQGEPFGSPVICAQYHVFRRARETGTTVLLGGQGSDEIFAGYGRDVPNRLISLARAARYAEAWQLLGAASKRWGRSRRSFALSALMTTAPPALHRRLRKLRRSGGREDWIRTEWFAERGVHGAPRWQPHSRHAMRERLVHVLEHWDLQALLRYEDRSAMALSLENRVPFLAAPLVRFVLSLPEAHLVNAEAEPKAILRAAMRGLVPDAILDRHDKFGFTVPVVRWLVELAPWVEEKLKGLESCPALDAAAVRQHWAAVRERHSTRSAFVTWRCLTLLTWAERSPVRFT